MDVNLMNLKIAVDFDGTIVEHKYPEIGEVRLFAFETLKALQKKGFSLILWTFRTGTELEEAVEFCRQHDVEFYAVNKNYPEEEFDETVSRKIDADIYIDDKNLGGFPGWSKVWEILVPDEMELKNKMFKKSGKNRFLAGLFGRRGKSMVITLFLLAGLMGVPFVSVGCREQGKTDKSEKKILTEGKEIPIFRPKKKIKFIRPKEVFTFQIGHPVVFELMAGDSLDRPDSVVIYTDDNRLGSYRNYHVTGTWNTKDANVGIHVLRAVAYDGKRSRRKNIHITLTSDFIPLQFSYRVVKIYPHDRNAYTQGLVYDDGYIFESTGLRGESSLRKWDPETGKVIESLNLPPDLFGEGICILGDQIYQLTWTSRVGFVYDKNTFTLKNRLHYATQGWGLTTDGKNLIMSDGTNNLYFLEPKYFTVIRKIEVYDDRGPVNQLNELEYIDSTVYANVYQTDDIVRIDPVCGKVLARINMKGILPRREYRSDTDVLNGIAWDRTGNRIFVTGKKWPKMFEVRFVPVH